MGKTTPGVLCRVFEEESLLLCFYGSGIEIRHDHEKEGPPVRILAAYSM